MLLAAVAAALPHRRDPVPRQTASSRTLGRGVHALPIPRTRAHRLADPSMVVV
jgi:hypothetical protein